MKYVWEADDISAGIIVLNRPYGTPIAMVGSMDDAEGHYVETVDGETKIARVIIELPGGEVSEPMTRLVIADKFNKEGYVPANSRLHGCLKVVGERER